MHIILLAGGASLRLWPFSGEAHAKQFIKLLDNGAGGKESMIQRTYRQLQTEFPDADVLIATNKEQEKQVRAQLGLHAVIVCEPQRRDTFAAIALSTAFLYTNKGLKEDDVVVALPVDGYVEQTYFSVVQRMVDLAASKVANLLLMGIRADRPSSHFGYIVPTSFQGGWSTVERFVEKPTVEIAEKLIEIGACWNGGVFAFTVGFLRGIVETLGQDFSFINLYNAYPTLPKKSFDYVVVEKENSIAMVQYNGMWKDLGTWDMLNSVTED